MSEPVAASKAVAARAGAVLAANVSPAHSRRRRAKWRRRARAARRSSAAFAPRATDSAPSARGARTRAMHTFAAKGGSAPASLATPRAARTSARAPRAARRLWRSSGEQ